MNLIVFRIPAWLLLVCFIVLTVVPAAERPSTGIQHDFEHILAFGLLGVWFALGYRDRPARQKLTSGAACRVQTMSRLDRPGSDISEIPAGTFGAAVLSLAPRDRGQQAWDSGCRD